MNHKIGFFSLTSELALACVTSILMTNVRNISFTFIGNELYNVDNCNRSYPF